jgi:hypothetical protein
MAVIFAVVCMILAQEPNAQEPLTLNGHTNRVNIAGVVAQVRPFFVELLTWSRDSWPIPLWSFPLVC